MLADTPQGEIPVALLGFEPAASWPWVRSSATWMLEVFDASLLLGMCAETELFHSIWEETWTLLTSAPLSGGNYTSAAMSKSVTVQCICGTKCILLFCQPHIFAHLQQPSSDAKSSCENKYFFCQTMKFTAAPCSTVKIISSVASKCLPVGNNFFKKNQK